jgi:hypothetical protein
MNVESNMFYFGQRPKYTGTKVGAFAQRTNQNAKALFRTDIEKELPLDIASGRNFEWVAPKSFWTEAQFQDMAIDLYKAGKLKNVENAFKTMNGGVIPPISDVENYIKVRFKVCCQ